MLALSYILPIRSADRVDDDFVRYVHALAQLCEVVIVDGSPLSVFQDLGVRCGDAIQHISPDADFKRMANGKVAGVLTGIRHSSHERLVIADDDVRYDASGLHAIARALDAADIVRPQNYFDPLPWHAWIDTGRTLVNRVTGGDWPGTLALRRTAFERAGGAYDGDVLFENLEMVRTIVASGGGEHVAYGLFVPRCPPSAGHYLSQRVRQAYDEFARPARMAGWLGVVPLLLAANRRYGVRGVGTMLLAVIVCAEIGRRRGGGNRVFPCAASLLAPVWLLERAICSWVALGMRVVLGGVPYRGNIIRRAATPLRELRAQHQQRSARRSEAETRVRALN